MLKYINRALDAWATYPCFTKFPMNFLYAQAESLAAGGIFAYVAESLLTGAVAYGTVNLARYLQRWDELNERRHRQTMKSIEDAKRAALKEIKEILEEEEEEEEQNGRNGN